MEVKKLQLNCKTHKDKVIYIKVNDIQDDKSIFYCADCTKRDRNFRAQDCVLTKKIREYTPNSIKSIIYDWPPLEDQQIYNSLEDITFLDIEDEIKIIETYFDSLKEKLFSSINGCKKKFVSFLQDQFKNDEHILKTYKDIAKIMEFQDIILENNIDISQKEIKCKQFIQTSIAIKKENSKILKNLLDERIDFQSIFKNEKINSMRNQLLSLADELCYSLLKEPTHKINMKESSERIEIPLPQKKLKSEKDSPTNSFQNFSKQITPIKHNSGSSEQNEEQIYDQLSLLEVLEFEEPPLSCLDSQIKQMVEEKELLSILKFYSENSYNYSNNYLCEKSLVNNQIQLKQQEQKGEALFLSNITLIPDQTYRLRFKIHYSRKSQLIVGVISSKEVFDQFAYHHYSFSIQSTADSLYIQTNVFFQDKTQVLQGEEEDYPIDSEFEFEVNHSKGYISLLDYPNRTTLYNQDHTGQLNNESELKFFMILQDKIDITIKNFCNVCEV